MALLEQLHTQSISWTSSYFQVVTQTESLPCSRMQASCRHRHGWQYSQGLSRSVFNDRSKLVEGRRTSLDSSWPVRRFRPPAAGLAHLGRDRVTRLVGLAVASRQQLQLVAAFVVARWRSGPRWGLLVHQPACSESSSVLDPEAISKWLTKSHNYCSDNRLPRMLDVWVKKGAAVGWS
jgi:hypothetical protein